MVNNLRLGMKSLRYSYGWKRTMVCMALLTVPGVVMAVAGPHLKLGIFSGFILVIEAIFPMQLLASLGVSNMLQASPLKKKMQTSVPALFCTFCMTAVFLLSLLICGIRVMGEPAEIQAVCEEIVQYALWMACVMMYLAVTYKYFLVATIFFLAVNTNLWSGYLGSRFVNFSALEGVAAPFLAAAALGLGIIAAGGILEYLLSLLVYKAPMSKQAQSASLRREL